MPKQLPETTNFLKQAERNVTLEGPMPLVKLERLSGSLHDNSGELFATLRFTSGTGYLGLNGTVEASLDLICQRCLQPMKHEVSGQFKFGLMTDEKYEDKVPSDAEPYLLEGDEQSVIDILEDELLLSIPIRLQQITLFGTRWATRAMFSFLCFLSRFSMAPMVRTRTASRLSPLGKVTLWGAFNQRS
jgi:uncharacterized protein